MPGTDSLIGLPTDGPGKSVDTDQLTTGAGTVQRERHRMAGSGAAELADVKAAELAVGDYGLGVRLIPKTFKPFNVSASASGDNTIVAAVGGKRIKVIWWEIISTDMSVEVNAKWRTATTDVLGPRLIAPGSLWEKGPTSAPNWLFATVAGEALVLNLSAAIAVRVMGQYFDDDAA